MDNEYVIWVQQQMELCDKIIQHIHHHKISELSTEYQKENYLETFIDDWMNICDEESITKFLTTYNLSWVPFELLPKLDLMSEIEPDAEKCKNIYDAHKQWIDHISN